jgi:EAL domain-containing protein (putative c-di-GMP-specific phosphodiesterase class I)
LDADQQATQGKLTVTMSGELKILMLEDVPEEAEVLQRELHKSGLEFVARRVQTRHAFGQALEQFAPDLVLADSRLPAFDGRTALQMVRQKDPLMPVIMVTGALGDEAAVEFLIAGASDYVLKDRLARLAPAVQRALRDTATNRERQEAEQRIRRLTRVLQMLSGWQDPERGLVAPGEFLPVLESTGLILGVGEWVLRQAAEAGRRWRHFDLPHVRVAVNVSTAELSQPGLADRFLHLAAADDGSRVDLDVEITEGELLQDSASVTEALQQLRAEGVRVAIDDFGTGFSSLSRLSELPIDILKIDCSFVRRLTPDRASHAVVSTIIALARSYDLDTVAEGVETADQLEILAALGCEISQGYLHSPAVPAETIDELLRAGPAAHAQRESL